MQIVKDTEPSLFDEKLILPDNQEQRKQYTALSMTLILSHTNSDLVKLFAKYSSKSDQNYCFFEALALAIFRLHNAQEDSQRNFYLESIENLVKIYPNTLNQIAISVKNERHVILDYLIAYPPKSPEDASKICKIFLKQGIEPFEIKDENKKIIKDKNILHTFLEAIDDDKKEIIETLLKTIISVDYPKKKQHLKQALDFYNQHINHNLVLDKLVKFYSNELNKKTEKLNSDLQSEVNKIKSKLK